MVVILPSAALTVRFLTRRFIGEYGDMGECQGMARLFPVRDGDEDLPAGFHCFSSPLAFLHCVCLLPGGAQWLSLFSDPSPCSTAASLGCRRSWLAAGGTSVPGLM